MTVAIYGRSIEPEFFPYLKRLVEGLERKGVGMVCEEKFAALLSGNYGYEPKFLNCFGRCTLINEVLDTLTEREQKVLRLRFGMDDGRARTLEEVGKEFQVTRERIRQIEAKALRRLRHPSKSRKLKDYLDAND